MTTHATIYIIPSGGMGLVLPKSYCKSTLSLHLQILEAGDIDGDGEEALELDDELAGAGAAPGLQGSDLAVEPTMRRCCK